MPEYPLHPDPRATLIGKGDFQIYKDRLPELFLKQEVPAVVKEHINVAHQILIHSYFVYEFIDVAFTQAIIGLEKALRIRYEEIEGAPKKQDFIELIKWAHTRSLFELEKTDIIDIYRRLRNSKVHDAKNTLGGFVYLGKIKEPVFFINDLYEDPVLRKQRLDSILTLRTNVKLMYTHGAIYNDGTGEYIIKGIHPIFLDNKVNELSLSITPLANIEEVMKYTAFPSIDLRLTKLVVSVEDRKIEGVDTLSQKLISIYPLSDMNESAIVIPWEQQYQKVEAHFMAMCQGKLNIHLNDIYIKCLERFYKR